MGIDFGVIWHADFNNVIRFYVHRTSRWLGVIRRPPSHQNLNEMTRVTRPPAITPIFKEDDRYMVMGGDFGVIYYISMSSCFP